jgi:6-pyruvoyltetrahydropterin/6-carboxytetrahydropterin synthase
MTTTTKYSVTRALEFDAGHRLLNHESACFLPHGHRYKVEITCEGYDLNPAGV